MLAVLQSRSEPRFFGWSRSRFKKMLIFHCILYIFFFIINTGSTCRLYLVPVPTVKYKTRWIFWDWVNLFFLSFFPVFGTKSRFIGAFFNQNLDFSNVLYKNQLFWTGAGRSRVFMGGAGADIFYQEPEPPKKYLEPEPRKIGLAPQH